MTPGILADISEHNGHAQNEYANYLATRAAAKQDSSGGLVESRFDDWVAEEQAKERYLDFFPTPPTRFEFKAARALPRA
jgi:ribonuclease HI